MEGTAATRPLLWQRKSSRNTSRFRTGRRTRGRSAPKEKTVQIDRRLISHFDWTLFLLMLTFVFIGVVTIYSANYNIIEKHAGGLPSRQLIWLGLGLIAMSTAIAFDYHYID